MHVRRTLWFGAGSIAVATWLAAATTSGIRTPSTPQTLDAESPLARSLAGVQSDVARLHQRIAPAAAPLARRDLFRFQAPASRPSSPPADAQTPLSPSAPIVERALPMTLIGVAEDASADGVVRTAIVSAQGDVLLLEAGDVIADRFRVLSVAARSVDLLDLSAAGSTITLTLR